MLIAGVALFVALGGTAAALTGHNSIKNDDVVDLNFHRLDLINGWTPYGVGYRRPAIAIDDQGVVHLRGAVHQLMG